MKLITGTAGAYLFTLLLIAAGCGPATPTSPQPPIKADNGPGQLAIYARYVPAKIHIMPLTEFICVDGAEEPSKIRVYVTLLDLFGSQIKTPAKFRFELYNYVERSAEPKGKRIAIWPDMDLTGPAENNNYWRDFFRAYEFDVDFSPHKDQTYILEATCLCPNGRRLSADFILKYTK